MLMAVALRYGKGMYTGEAYQFTEADKKMFMDNGISIIPVCDKNTINEIVKIADGLYIPGGPDVDPKFYGEEMNGTKDFYDEIDELDLALIDAFYKANKPILGICRGHQIINVYFGGTLYQDIGGHDETEHEVNVKKGSFIDNIYQTELLHVNSYHHQNIKDVAPGFEVVCTSTDGYVEAIAKDKIVSVQWHPEMYDGKRFIEGVMKELFKF